MLRFSFAVLAIAVALVAAGSPADALQQQPKTLVSAQESTSTVDLNTATAAQLESLPGIGATMAERILDYRQEHGDFSKIEELMNVRGIGEKSFLKLRPLVSVTPVKARRTAAGS